MNRRRVLLALGEDPVSTIPKPLDELYEAHHAMVYRTAHRITGNAPDAEDVMQTVFMRMLKRDSAAMAEIDNPESYLRRAAVNAALDIVRARQADNTLELEHMATSGSCTELRDLRDTMRRALSKLTSENGRDGRAAIFRRVYQSGDRKVDGDVSDCGRGDGASRAQETSAGIDQGDDAGNHAEGGSEMKNREFDEVMDAVRNDVPDAQAIREAAARVRSRLEAEAGGSTVSGADLSSSVEHLNSCADFRAAAAGLSREHFKRSAANAGGGSSAFLRGLPPGVSRRPPDRDSDHLETFNRYAGDPQSDPLRDCRRRTRGHGRDAAAGVRPGIRAGRSARDGRIDRRRRSWIGPAGGLYLVSEQGLMALSTGARLNEHDEIRTAKGSRAVVELRDGSRIEMAERSGLTISEHWSGKSIYLDRGSVMIEAAKQRRGRLEVITPDCAVSVKGTIFEVSRGTKGSRVSVVEGEVKVDEEGATHLLHRGDQTATSVSMSNTSVAQDVAWSANSAKYLALLGEFSAIREAYRGDSGAGLALSIETRRPVAGKHGDLRVDSESGAGAGRGQQHF